MSVKQVINLGAGKESEAVLMQNDATCHIAISSVTATALPSDQAERLDAEVLRSFVDEEVERLCKRGAAAQDFPGDDPNHRELLGVLAFAYARRVFDSEDIAERCLTDASFRQLCNGHAPFASELIKFRRRNRPLLETVLANVLLRANEHSQPNQPPGVAPAVKRQMLCHAATRLDTARHVDTASE